MPILISTLDDNRCTVCNKPFREKDDVAVVNHGRAELMDTNAESLVIGNKEPFQTAVVHIDCIKELFL